jgi:hypothetical protein
MNQVLTRQPLPAPSLPQPARQKPLDQSVSEVGCHHEGRSEGENDVGEVGNTASDNVSTTTRHAVVSDVVDTPNWA